MWLPALIRDGLTRRRYAGPADVYFCLADHYEPGWRLADANTQRVRVGRWLERYPACASRHRDSAGRPPQHTFFFPVEEYSPEHLDGLALLCKKGFGDVEVHLHHDRDTPQHFGETLEAFADVLYCRHGLLRKDTSGKIRYGFIHGNWTLNNALRDGRYCGVDDETSILLATGCYADFTMPCGPFPEQSRKLNSIYYTIPQATPRAHDAGPNARAGVVRKDGLLTIQGPMSLRWDCRKWGVLPHIEHANLAWDTPPSPRRIDAWIGRHIHVEGAPEHVLVKVCTHGATEKNAAFLLNGGLDALWTSLENYCWERGHRLHYVTAYEMFLKVRELECGVPQSTPIQAVA
jgi:hypothetical protein